MHHVVIFKMCGDLGLLSLSTSMSVQHRELLGLSQFLEMMVKPNVNPGRQINCMKRFACALKQKVEYGF